MIILLFLAMIVVVVVRQVRLSKKEKLELSPAALRRKRIDYIVKVSIFSAISIILYLVPFLQFKLPMIFPSFFTFQFSNLPAILCGFVLGPLAGILVIIIKTIPGLFTSSTACVGEMADLLIGGCVVLASSLIYQKHKTIKGGILSLVVGSAVWVVSAIIINYTVLIDWYAYLYFGGSRAPIIGICQALIPSINESNFMPMYLVACCLPFNLTLSLITSLITFILYKRISKIFKKEFFKKQWKF